jgi:hypothetical protein
MCASCYTSLEENLPTTTIEYDLAMIADARPKMHKQTMIVVDNRRPGRKILDNYQPEPSI